MIEYEKKVFPKESGIAEGTGFHLYEITAKNSRDWNFQLPVNSQFTVAKSGGDPSAPSPPPLKLEGKLKTPTGETIEVTLVPIGTTILLRTTFKQASWRHAPPLLQPAPPPPRPNLFAIADDWSTHAMPTATRW